MMVRGLLSCCLLAWMVVGPSVVHAEPATAKDTNSANAQPSPAGHLFSGTRFATPYYVVESGRPGPTVLVTAGIHGDEPAPPVAAKRLLAWQLHRGCLVVVPEVNRPALAAGTRYTPGTKFADLNRNFPTAYHGLRGERASELWRFAAELAPSWVLDLHEGWDFHRRNPKSVGSSVTYVHHVPGGEAARARAHNAVTAVNATIDEPSRHLALITPGPAGSFARSVSEQLAIPSLVLETTRVAQALPLRVTQQLVMLRAVLADLRMVKR